MPQHRLYEIKSSPFYKLSSKAKLCAILNSNQSLIKKMLPEENYYIFDQVNHRTNKTRKIYAPKPNIKKVQKRLQILLSRLYLPEYLFSGKKNCCYVDNAKFHQAEKYIINFDICKFYTSCRKEYIFKSFRYDFNMTEDVAWLLADIVSYKNFLPTGSPTSQIVAFLAYRPTFDRLNKLAISHNAKFSLFVDDMSFSAMKPFPKNFSFLVSKERC